MAIGKNIRFHRDIRLGWTLERLSEACGVDVGTISALENRDSKRSMYFAKIATGLGLTLDELEIPPEEFLETTKNTNKQFVTDKPNKHYPRVVGAARMGDQGYYIDLDGGDGFVEFETEHSSIAIQVRGDSMFPAIRDGWFIIIEEKHQPVMGEYVLIKFKDERKMVKELISIKSDCYVVMSVNGNERLTVMQDDIYDILGITAVVPPSKHKT